MTRYKTILFDLDGTLIDSAPDIAAALNRLLAAAGRKMLPLSAVRRMIGDGAACLIRRGFEETGGFEGDIDDYLTRFLRLYEGAIACHTRPYPGVVNTLADLKEQGYRLAVCTNKPLIATQLVLEELDLAHFFEDIAGGDSFPVRKPDPGHLLMQLARMSAHRDTALMVGDSQNDILAAKSAGIPVAALSYGYTRVPVHELDPDHLLDRFDQLKIVLAGDGP